MNFGVYADLFKSALAFGLIIAMLLIVAHTPAYPIAIGVVLIALLYVLMHGSAVSTFDKAFNSIMKSL